MYSYTDGDPINQRDPSGGDSETLDWIARGLGIAGLLIGLGGASMAAKFSRAPGVINGQKAGIAAFWAGTAGAVVGAAAAGFQIAAMAAQSGSVSADQWAVAIGSSLGSIVSVCGAVKGYRLYRRASAVYRARLAARDQIRAQLLDRTSDPTLTRNAVAKLDPVNMTIEKMERTANRYYKRNVIGPAPAISENRKLGGSMFLQEHQLKGVPKGTQGKTPLAIIAEVDD